MRTTVMSDMLHGDLIRHLSTQRKGINDAIRLIEKNIENDWKGVPTINRRSSEERLPRLRIEQDRLTDWLDVLNAAPAH